MPRSAGIGRTGGKQKRARAAAAPEAVAKRQAASLAALEAAAAAAGASALVAAGDDGAVSAWLDDVLEQVEVQVRVDKAKDERELRRHEMHRATVVACAESLKKRVRPFGPEQSGDFVVMRPFFDALAQNVREWEHAYPADICSDCERHLGHCECMSPCRKCGDNVPRRAWCVSYLFPQRDMCRCEKFSIIGGRLFG